MYNAVIEFIPVGLAIVAIYFASGRMTHGFGKPGKLFVVNAVFFIFIVFHDPKFKQ